MWWLQLYDKFQNNETRKLEFTDIYKLVEPIKNLGESEWLADIYFIEKTLKEYAGLPENYKIKAFIEHAAQLSDYTEGGFSIHKSLPSIVPSSFRVSVIEGVLENNGAYAVGPYIAYAQSALSSDKLILEKERLGKNLLVFPAHSIRGLEAIYDINAFCEEIKKISENYDSVRVCLFWKDVLLGTAKIYKKYGFEVVTAGHYYDPMFMPRLKSIIETSTMTMSNKLGTYIGYCIYLNKPHFLLKNKVDMEKINSDGKLAEREYILSRKMRTKLKNRNIDQIFELLSENQEIITPEQYTLLNKYWGFTEVKSPKKLRRLILEIEGEYQLKNNSKKRIDKLNNVVKAKDGHINRLERDVKLNNDKIKALLLEIESGSQIKNDFEKRLDKLINVVKVKDGHINCLERDVKLNNDKIEAIMNSKSWKITYPLRRLKSYFK